jgi:serine/threonine protein kinase
MLGLDGQVKLTDFGIAKVLEATRMTTTGGVVGTAEYMSPEQAEGRVLDRRTDIYSLGVVLYRMLAGRPPFAGNTAVELMQQHRFSIPESPKELNPDIPMSVVNLIMDDMLPKVPASRIATAKALIMKLDKVEGQLDLTRKGEFRVRPIPRAGKADRNWLKSGVSKVKKYSGLILGLVMIALIIYAFPALRCERADEAKELYESAMLQMAHKNYERAKLLFWKLKTSHAGSEYAPRAEAELAKIPALILERDLGEKQNELIGISEEILGTKFMRQALREMKDGRYEDARNTLQSILTLFTDRKLRLQAEQKLREVERELQKLAREEPGSDAPDATDVPESESSGQE